MERSWKGVGKELEEVGKELESVCKGARKRLEKDKKRINFKGERQMAEALMAGSRNIPRNQQKLSKNQQ